MSNSHPYISGPGNIAKMVLQLRKAFPQTVNSETVKKLGLASNNESYVIGALQFVGVIDEEGSKTEEASRVFVLNKDEDFNKAFAGMVANAYKGLFELHGDEAWELEPDDLLTFFRQSDQTSEAIGKRQANTFKVFSSLSGYGEPPKISNPKSASKPKVEAKKKASTSTAPQKKASPTILEAGKKNIGLTVRVEINLPADGTKETYDNIFKSIKENLIND